MHLRKLLIVSLILSSISRGLSQEDIGYRTPPAAITQLAEAAPTPSVRLSPDRQWLLLMERPGMPGIEELAAEELRLAGLRIDPAINGSSRGTHFSGFTLQSINQKKQRPIAGLPTDAQLGDISWSPDGRHFAFTHTTETGIELWLADVAAATARKLTEPVLNDIFRGGSYSWLSDNRTIVYKAVPEHRGAAPKAGRKPQGPVVSVNEGQTAPARTYQDLLQNAHDEALFAHYGSAHLMLLDTETGTARPLPIEGIIMDVTPAPGGDYLLVTTLHRPFSYLVPYYRFPQTVAIYDRAGKLVHTVAELPLTEELPIGFNAVPTGPRSFGWRADAPATLYWVEAQDGGDPRNEAEVRDKLFYLPAPFNGDKQEAISFQLRFAGITWGNDKLALAREMWWKDRREILSRWQPAQPSASKQVLHDRSYEDRYNDPGDFASTVNAYGRSVLLTADKGQTLYRSGAGASAEGNRPFVDRYDLSTGKTTRLWRSEGAFYEYPVAFVDPDKGLIITSRESQELAPNYYLRDLKKGKLQPLTDFENPYTALDGITKELVKYQREDGIELSGTLYLPAGFRKGVDAPLPTIMWAYPREYKSAEAASQVTGSPHQFPRISWGSPIFWLTQGYAVFDNFAMPILGEGDEEPNETFVKQLRMNAKSAIDKLVEMKVTDPARIGVGGHSYGAFMTANLLAHTDLFAAGIARSGAYNRTLTPFGFQAEERSFWEAPEIYFNMSPFMHADKIKTPILLIHGEADNNSGTFPMQSERFFAALKGHGATARLVMLPHESHGYQARESVLHMLWEMDQWMEKYVKNRQPEGKVKP